jgi:phasin family protein
MADSDDPKAEASAETAYVAAAEAASDTDTPKAEGNAEPIESGEKAKRGRKPRAAADVLLSEQASVETPVVAAAAVEPAPAAAPKAKARRIAAKPPKPVVKRAAARPGPGKAAPINIRKPVVHKIKTASKVAPKSAVSVADAPKVPLIEQLKETPMDITATVTDAVAEAQEKAKEAVSKTTALAGEYGEFAKGNVEAFVESGKILAAGLQDMGSKFVADSKSVFETLTADVKDLSSVKSPTDLFKLQTALLRRNFDTAVAYGSKTSEAMLKLTNEVIAPISGRVSLAVEKVRNAA